MFLTSIEIKNFRSLENVKLDNLRQFNVLLGRNNVGKSSVLGAFKNLTENAFKVKSSPNNDRDHLTAHDVNRRVWYRLVFRPDDDERERFINGLGSVGFSDELIRTTKCSAFLRQVAYEFESLAAYPLSAWLSSAHVWTSDGKWAEMLSADLGSARPGHPDVITPQWYTHQHVDQIRALSHDELAVKASDLGRQTLHINPDELQSNRHAPKIAYWLLPEMMEYFDHSYFFSPFRHSPDRGSVKVTSTLDSDGRNLPTILNHLVAGDRQRFESIDAAINDAIPGLGTLQPRLAQTDPQETPLSEITFRNADGYDVHLREMGGGVEQLLMVATVLATVRDKATLFMEEPEMHLHPGAQRFLMDQVREGSRQVFLTTHSSVFINTEPPCSIYLLRSENDRTRIERKPADGDFSDLMEEIGARNSDVLLADAVLFVEGSSDRDVVLNWSQTLNQSLDRHNIPILTMGGGRDAFRHAPIRSELLSGLSAKISVPHVFLLDRDERSNAELESLDRMLGDSLHILKRRELENYLLHPRAILAALRTKYQDNALVSEKLEASTSEDIDRIIQESAHGLYGLVLMKRIRAEVGGLRSGLIPDDVVFELTPRARDKELAALVNERVRMALDRTLEGRNVEELVDRERKRLDQEWKSEGRRIELAPGTEILQRVFNEYGAQYEKRKDTPRIAEAMSRDEIGAEVQELIDRLAQVEGA